MDVSGRIAASSVTFRDEPLDSALERLQTLGFVRFDLTAIRQFCDHFDPLLVDVGEEVCVRTRDLIASHALQTVSITTYPANPLASNLNGDDWTSGVDAYIRLALFLNPYGVIFPPGSPAPVPAHWRGTAERCLPWLRDAVDRARTAHLFPILALQSDSLLRTSQQARDFLKLLGMGGVGLAIDPAHLANMGEDPIEAIRAMGSAVRFVVLRDTDGTDFNLPPGTGNLDYPGILNVLDEIGYAGPLVLAIDDISIPAAQRADLLLRGWAYLDRLASRRAA